MAKARTLSPLAMDIATQMNAGKSLEQIRSQRPDLTDEHIAAFMKEMFELMGFAPHATSIATDLVRSSGKRDREFVEGHCFKLRVVLDDVKPQVWRRFVVPASITLDRLHDVLQIVMGWTDSHLHSFTIAGQEFTERASVVALRKMWADLGVIQSSWRRLPTQSMKNTNLVWIGAAAPSTQRNLTPLP